MSRLEPSTPRTESEHPSHSPTELPFLVLVVPKLSILDIISGETQQSVEDQMKAQTIQSEIVSHWHTNLTINLGKVLV